MPPAWAGVLFGTTGQSGQSAETPAHKCVGVACSTLSPQALPSLFGREACTRSLRQHLDSLSCEPPRGNQVQAFPTGGSEAPSLGLTSPCESQGDALTGCAEHSCRHAFPPKASSGGEPRWFRWYGRGSAEQRSTYSPQQRQRTARCGSPSRNRPARWGRMLWHTPGQTASCMPFLQSHCSC